MPIFCRPVKQGMFLETHNTLEKSLARRYVDVFLSFDFRKPLWMKTVFPKKIKYVKLCNSKVLEI